MKKLCLLIAVMLLSMCYVASASAQSQDTTLVLTDIRPYESASTICWVGDTLYILGGEGIYRWQSGLSMPETMLDLSETEKYRYQEQPPEDESGRASWERAIQNLFTDGTNLYAIQPFSGQIFLVTENRLEASVTLPAEQLYAAGSGQPIFRGIQDIAWADGALYLLLGTDDPSQWDKTELFRFDIVKEEMTPCSLSGIQNVYAGSAGKLLLSVRSNQAEGSGNLAAGIWQYDISSGTLEKQIMVQDSEMIMSSVFYLQQEKNIYYIQSGEIISMDDKGQTLVKAYLPIGAYGSSFKASVSTAGLYAYASGKYVFIRDITSKEATEKTVLHIMGDINPELVIRFSIANPDIALIHVLGDTSNSVLTFDSDIDLYVTSAPGVYATMKEKGYAAEMNQDSRLVDMANKLYPAIREVIFSGDKLLAYPLILTPESWTVNETLWLEFGLGDYPLTYKDLFAYIALWNEEYAQANPDYMLFDSQQDIAGYVAMIVKEYILQNETADSPLSFDSDKFRAAISDVIEYRAVLESNREMYGMPLLFPYYQGFGVGYNDTEKTIMVLPPSLGGSEAQAINVKAELVVVNQATKKQDQALRFVEFCASNNDITNRYMMDPSLLNPIRPANYQERLQTLQDELMQLQESMKDASAEQSKVIMESISSKQAAIKNIEDNDWLISLEGIENYRGVAQHMRIPYASYYLTESESSGFAALQPIIERYCTQGLSADTVDRFIEELNRVSQMIHAEGM